VDRIREAGATIVAATQSPTSYFPAFKAKDKAMTYMNNLRNRVICTAADKEEPNVNLAHAPLINGSNSIIPKGSNSNPIDAK
jgi:hypothetical protein